MKKKCFKCGVERNLDDFYLHPRMADKHLNKCKTCAKKDVQKRYSNPIFREKIREYERLRFQNPERKKKILKYQRNRRKIHPEKSQANQKLRRAIKKKLHRYRNQREVLRNRPPTAKTRPFTPLISYPHYRS